VEPAFQFQLITPAGKVYAGEAVSLVVSGERGYFGVLARHAPLIANCSAGKLKVREKDGREMRFETGKGFFEVFRNQAVLLTEQAGAVTT